LGLSFNRKITVEEWESLGLKLGMISTAVFWWIGDFLIFGDQLMEATEEQRSIDRRNKKRAEHGILQKYSAIFGLTPQYLSDIRGVCLRVGIKFRHVNLTGSHSLEILRHVPDSQFPFWSKRTLDENLSVRDLRIKLRDHNRTENPTPQTTRPTLFAQKAMDFAIQFEAESANWSQAEWVSYASIMERVVKAFRERGL